MSKPFLKWAGGKHKLVPFIEKHIPETRKRLIEPFAGSAALSMALEFESYVLNDVNRDLIALYRTLQIEQYQFIEYTRSFFTPENNQEVRFYDFRERFNESNDPAEKSALFIYLNRHAFNGLCRYNKKGLFNVPYGRYKSPYFPEKEMRAFVAKSDRISLMCGHFSEVFPLLGEEDTVYCDPPYVPLSDTASFSSYAQHGFSLQEQKQLATLVTECEDKVRLILVSNHNTDFTQDIYHNASIQTVDVQRNIAAKGSSRQKVQELLAVYAS